jgi:hypothetical protein
VFKGVLDDVRADIDLVQAGDDGDGGGDPDEYRDGLVERRYSGVQQDEDDGEQLGRGGALADPAGADRHLPQQKDDEQGREQYSCDGQDIGYVNRRGGSFGGTSFFRDP